MIQVIPHPDTHYFIGRAAQLLAGAYLQACPAGAQVGLTRDQLRHYCRSRATHDAESAQRYGGDSLSYWFASDAEFVARQVGKPLHDELQSLYVEVFRASRR